MNRFRWACCKEMVETAECYHPVHTCSDLNASFEAELNHLLQPPLIWAETDVRNSLDLRSVGPRVDARTDY